MNRNFYRILLLNVLILVAPLKRLFFKLILEKFSYPSPLSAGEKLSMQQPPHHPASNLDVDAKQAEAIVVMFQLIPNSLVQGLF